MGRYCKIRSPKKQSPQKQRQKVHIIGENDESLTSETSGYSGEKVTILSASLARQKGKTENPNAQKTGKIKKKKKETTRQRQKEELWN